MRKSDKENFHWIHEHLYVAAVCDILDSLGYRQQAMHQRLRPLLPDRRQCGFVGRARTFRWMETNYIVEKDPYGLEIEAMDSLQPGDVVVHSSDPGSTNAPWGELMSTVAKHNGAVGCVCDSQVRDCNRIIDMGFPVYYAVFGRSTPKAGLASWRTTCRSHAATWSCDRANLSSRITTGSW